MVAHRSGHGARRVDPAGLDLDPPVTDAGRTDRGQEGLVPDAGDSAAVDVLAGLAAHRAWLEDGRLERHRETRRLAQVHRAVVEAVDGELWEAAGWRERAASLLASGEAHYDVVAGLIEELRAQAREAAGGGTNER